MAALSYPHQQPIHQQLQELYTNIHAISSENQQLLFRLIQMRVNLETSERNLNLLNHNKNLLEESLSQSRIELARILQENDHLSQQCREEEQREVDLDLKIRDLKNRIARTVRSKNEAEERELDSSDRLKALLKHIKTLDQCRQDRTPYPALPAHLPLLRSSSSSNSNTYLEGISSEEFTPSSSLNSNQRINFEGLSTGQSTDERIDDFFSKISRQI
eukprot:TRINITY_DN131_c0_g2_i1.p1 TRINITY_DN131_c0_g2~~TRINITY_DN131_c0_g2_i1.p1  ORF type:complete len:217 (+),score=54.17 TRINITY_DN131_c0_g2_i1:261-911(+)